ncbi:MAG: hypothetical protein M1817_006484 [Caeruleum heppii]|nr:MAG: hypothetical protein M1817_006484 [Caeruleum heppii]
MIPSRPLTDLEQAEERLSEASADLRSLLSAPVSLSPVVTQGASNNGMELGRRIKRRRLNTDPLKKDCSSMRYGFNGEVVPAPLRLEIVSCDGGNYSEGIERSYGADNVLRDDPSVYCTKSSCCNLLLRHQGGTAFTLREVIIKAPKSGFDAPVQEGMLFIGMSYEDLASRDPYCPPQRSSAPRVPLLSRSGSPRSSQQTLRDMIPITPNESSLQSQGFVPEHNTSFDAPRHASQDYGLTMHGPRDTNDTNRSDYDLALSDADSDAGDSSEVFDTKDPGSSPLRFTVTTCLGNGEDDVETGEAIVTQSQVLASHRVRSTTPFAAVTEGSESGSGILGEQHTESWRSDDVQSRLRRRSRSITDDGDARLQRDQAISAERRDIRAPHAYFLLREGKSSCSMTFEPPVSGRLLLVKLWNPSQLENIDVESIVVKGFAGPRFFPATELR